MSTDKPMPAHHKEPRNKRVRLFVPDFPMPEGEVTLSKERSHYLATVMRLTVGDEIAIFGRSTGVWRARILDSNPKRTQLSVVGFLGDGSPDSDLWLLAAPLKRGRIDWVAEKACELGVRRFIPTLTDRTIVRSVALDRLEAHMIEAAEQCERASVPEVAQPIALSSLLASWDKERPLFFCDEEGGEPFLDVVSANPSPHGAILIGPEGGFTPQERTMIRSCPAALSVSLGPRILRADTAAVAAIALWQAQIGDKK